MREFFIAILMLIASTMLIAMGTFRLGTEFCNSEELTFHYEIDFKGDECQIMNEKFVICKYKSLDDLEITDFKEKTNEK